MCARAHQLISTRRKYIGSCAGLVGIRMIKKRSGHVWSKCSAMACCTQPSLGRAAMLNWILDQVWLCRMSAVACKRFAARAVQL